MSDWTPLGEPREIPGTCDYAPQHSFGDYVLAGVILLLFVALIVGVFVVLPAWGFVHTLHIPPVSTPIVVYTRMP